MVFMPEGTVVATDDRFVKMFGFFYNTCQCSFVNFSRKKAPPKIYEITNIHKNAKLLWFRYFHFFMIYYPLAAVGWLIGPVHSADVARSINSSAKIKLRLIVISLAKCRWWQRLQLQNYWYQCTCYVKHVFLLNVFELLFNNIIALTITCYREYEKMVFYYCAVLFALREMSINKYNSNKIPKILLKQNRSL